MRDTLLEELYGYEDMRPYRGWTGDDRVINYGVLALFLLLVAAFFFPRVFVPVHSGEAGVVWDGFSGTRAGVTYGPGVHIVAPWNTFYKYDVRPQSMPLECEALSRSGLPVKVSASVRFRLAGAGSSLGALHQRVGPDYREKLVSPIVVGAVRDVLGRYRAQDLYPLHSQRIQREILAVIADRRSREQFSDEQSVDFIDVRIGSVTLPNGLRTAIERKLAEEQAMLAYDVRLLDEKKEAQRKSIEAEGIRASNNRIPNNRQ